MMAPEMNTRTDNKRYDGEASFKIILCKQAILDEERGEKHISNILISIS